MATHPAPSWDQEPLYLESTRRSPRNGDAPNYIVPPKGDVANQDVTSFVVGQSTWSLHNLPEVLYRIAPPSTRLAFSKTPKPHQKRDAQGNPVFESWPSDPANSRPLLDYAVLSDQIASGVEWWRMTAWRRLEPRMSWADIIMRIRPANGSRTRDVQVDTRALNARIFNKRKEFGILSWDNSRGGKDEDSIAERLSAYPGAIERNSSRGVTPGLIDPTGPDVAANRVPVPDTSRKPYNKAGGPSNLAANTQNSSVSPLSSMSDLGSSLEHTPEPPPAARDQRNPVDFLADRLLIAASKGVRALEPGASTNFEDWSPSP
ncbi:MAG: hypothetical protein HETSPECPRED_004414 [Heterodermia speciosa]|uniref:Uncharacterized protein n=1 Tax=Heterodermia speciosa TaxID=116794 RepID=A0A8H3IJG7_9LECA|nr:MAG: hypothetical protein HETSPECPRED_004414 [Heterodermia speciosa]